MAQLAFPALALLATVLVACGRPRDFGLLTAAAAFLLALALMIAVNKFYAYALWLGTPLVAAAALTVFDWLKLTSLVPRFLVALLITPATVTFGAMTIASAAGTREGIDLNPPERQACVRMQNYAPLARLPIGLLVADQLEWGSYLLAWTGLALAAVALEARQCQPNGERQVLAARPLSLANSGACALRPKAALLYEPRRRGGGV